MENLFLREQIQHCITPYVDGRIFGFNRTHGLVAKRYDHLRMWILSSYQGLRECITHLASHFSVWHNGKFIPSGANSTLHHTICWRKNLRIQPDTWPSSKTIRSSSDVNIVELPRFTGMHSALASHFSVWRHGEFIPSGTNSTLHHTICWWKNLRIQPDTWPSSKTIQSSSDVNIVELPRFTGMHLQRDEKYFYTM
jgi:hypothetical protein